MTKKQKIIIGFLTGVALLIAGNWLLNSGTESTDDATIEAHVIAISPKVPGYIAALNIKDNQHVQKGDILAEIDPRDYKLHLDASKAMLASAEVSANNANVNAKRQIAIGRSIGTQKEIDNAVALAATAEAAVDNARAQVAIAAKNLQDSKIIAPEDGIITMRTAEQGSYASTGQQLFTIISDERWVVANFKEVQITNMRPGQKAKITVDAYPELKLEGKVDSIQNGTGARFSAFPAENATGNFIKIVQRVPVKITITSKIPVNITLGAGLSVRPIIYTNNDSAK